jgi:predicted ATPase/DNA-binding SARP family transcriptional activator
MAVQLQFGTPKRFKIRLAPRLSVSHGSTVIDHFSTARSAWLLARLALPPVRPYSRAHLCHLLWPDDPLDSALPMLRTELHRLRKSLMEAEVIVGANRREIWLDSSIASSDLEEEARNLKNALAQPDAPLRIRLLEAALDSAIDPVLSDIDEGWLDADRAKIEGNRVQAKIALAAALAEVGNDGEARNLLVATLFDQPTSEPVAFAAVDCLVRGENYREALELWRFHEESMRGPASERIRLAAATAKAKLDQPGPAPMVGMPASNVPAAISDLVGRTQDLASLANLLSTEGAPSRLVTLVGPGGVGKTRLALAAAEAARTEFEGRVWYVPLDGLTDPDGIGSEILSRIGIPLRGDSDATTVLAWRLAPKPSLLVLDNFEQLLPSGRKFLKRLLEEKSQLRILVTSRLPLEISGETCYEVRPLPCEGQDSPAVELFLQEARRRDGCGAGLEEARLEIAQIVNWVDGLPLAICLAAAKLRILTTSELVSELTDPLATLVGQESYEPARHRSLERTLAWSLDHLSPDQRRVFACLGIFRGGWTRFLGEELVGRPIAAELEALCAHSLVQANRTSQGMRFRMLETVREAAMRTQEARAVLDLERRHFDAVYAFAESQYQRSHSTSQLASMRALDEELDNLNAALQFGIENDVERAVGLCRRLARYWSVKSRHREARRWLELVLSKQPARSKERAFVYFWLARICHEQRDHAGALRWFTCSYEDFEAVGFTQNRALVWMNQADTYNDLGQFEMAGELARRSLAFMEEAGFVYDAKFALDELARSELGLGNVEQALVHARKMVAQREECTDAMQLAYGRLVLARVCAGAGLLSEAKEVARNALEVFQDYESLHGFAEAQVMLLEIDALESPDQIVADRLEQCRTAYEVLGDASGYRIALHRLARAGARLP